jgi:hypothetical protein
MLILSATTDSLDVVLNTAHATAPHKIVTAYRDITTSAFTPGRRVVDSNGATHVQAVTAPAASTQRVIDFVNVFNADTASRTVTISFNDNGTRFTLISTVLAIGERIEYQEGQGWRLFDSAGRLKQIEGKVASSTISTTGLKASGMIFKSAGQPTTVANMWHSYFAATAIPGAGTLATGNTTAGIIPTEATAGAMPFADPAGGAAAYIVGATVSSTISGTVMLYDRCFALGALTPTSGAYAGPVTGTALDRPAAGASTMIAAEIVTGLSAAAHTVTITYTNQNGDTGRTATVVLPASAGIGRVFFATLQAGDSGVRQITGVSGSATPPTGTFNLLIIRPLLVVGVTANAPRTLGREEAGLTPLYANTCAALMFYNPTGTTAATLQVTVALAVE